VEDALKLLCSMFGVHKLQGLWLQSSANCGDERCCFDDTVHRETDILIDRHLTNHHCSIYRSVRMRRTVKKTMNASNQRKLGESSVELQPAALKIIWRIVSTSGQRNVNSTSMSFF